MREGSVLWRMKRQTNLLNFEIKKGGNLVNDFLHQQRSPSKNREFCRDNSTIEMAHRNYQKENSAHAFINLCRVIIVRVSHTLDARIPIVIVDNCTRLERNELDQVWLRWQVLLPNLHSCRDHHSICRMKFVFL